MCGIVGYIGKSQAAPILLEGLRRLEYRGYDSAGMATIDGTLHYAKGVGKLDEVRARCPMDTLPGNIGIGHVRWATHGGVTGANAHPHLDCKNKIAVVHNGIIENHYELRERLTGHEFRSETDTEVIPHLIEHYMGTGSSLQDAVMQTTSQLRGSWAFLAISSSENRIVAARKDSPLVVGIGELGVFAASDTQALVGYADSVAYLEDGEMAVLTDTVK